MSTRNYSFVLNILLFVLIVSIVSFSMIFYELRYTKIGFGQALVDGELTSSQEKAIDTRLDLTSLFLTWALGLIAGTAFFLKLNIEGDLKLKKIDLLFTFLIILFSIYSLFFGHIVFIKTAEILALQQLPVTHAVIRQASLFQYTTGLAALTIFGLHILQFFWRRTNAETN